MVEAGAVVLLLMLGSVPAFAREHVFPLSRAHIGLGPVTIHDTVLPLRGRFRARDFTPPAGSYGGQFSTADGTLVTVYMWPGYVADQSVAQSAADLFDGFYHGAELSSVTIYLAPISEVQADCNSSDADSCFDPSSDTIYLPGNTPPDGTPVEEIAAHEYGHAIAFARHTAFGIAYNTGPEHWMSYEGVCVRTADGTAFPGDEGAHYSQNPGEAWADTNRILNGGSPSLWQFDQSFYPNSTDLRLARQDILQPWSGNSRYDTTGTFHHGHARNQYVTLVTPDDGRGAIIKLFAHGSLRNNLYLSDAANGQRVGQSHNVGLYQAVPFSICGGRKLKIRVYRRSGYGRFTLRAYIP